MTKRLKKIKNRSWVAIILILTLLPILIVQYLRPVNSSAASWNFDEGYGSTTTDAASTGYAATISGAVWRADDLCLTGKCLYFDGSDDYVSTSSTSVFNAGSAYTVMAWIRPTFGGESATETFISKTGVVDFNISDTNDNVIVTYTGGTSASSTNNAIYQNRWNHIAITHNGSGTVAIYVNGVDVTSDATVTDTDAAGSVLFGTELTAASTQSFQGFMDMARIYTRELTAAEIKVEYGISPTVDGGASVILGKEGTGGSNQFLSDGLVGYWKLDQSSGDASDSSGNGLTLTNNGTTTYVAGKFGRGSEHVPASSQYFSTASTVSGIRSVSFWVNPDSTTNYYASLTSSAYITSSGGTISATGFTSPTIYVNGVESSTLVADSWQLVTVVTSTPIEANQLYLGRQSTNYFDGTLEEFRLYNRTLTAKEINELYKWSPGPVGYWNFDENTGTSSNDSSTNGNNGSNTNGESADWTQGKYGSGLKVDGVDENVSISDSSTLDITSPFSLMGWVNVTSAGVLTPLTITHDASSSTTGANTTSVTLSHTVANQSNRMLVVGVTSEDSEETELVASSVTYNGDAMSLAIGRTQAATTDRRAEIWYLVAPDVGTHDVVVTFTGTTSSIAIGATSLYNVSQVAPEATGQGGSANATETTINITTLTNNAWVVDSVMNGATGGFTAGTDQVERWDQTAGGHQGAGSTKPIATAGATSMTQTNVSSSGMSHVAAAFAPATSSTDGTLFGKGTDTYQINISSAFGLTAYLNTSNTTTATLTTGWHHVAMVYNGATLKLYIDGVEQSSANVTGSVSTNNTALTIANYVNGIVDEVRLYDYPRTPGQLQQDINGGHPVGGSPISSQIINWKFDEQQGTTANNTNSTYVDGTVANAVWKTKSNCKMNGCLQFDGSGDVVSVATASDVDVDFAGSEAFSGSAWVYVTTMPGSGEQDAIISKWDETSSLRGYRLYVENDDADTTGNFEVEIYDESTDQVIRATVANDTVSTNTWYHVAFTFNGGTTGAASDLKLYVDGKQRAASSTNASFLGLEDVASDFTVGEYDATDVVATNTGFTGYLDEVKVYNAQLTEEQLRIDMTANAAIDFGSSGAQEASLLSDGAGNPPVGYWQFDDNSGTTVKDISGNGNNGTFGSTPSWIQGKYGSAVYFDDNDSYVTVADPAGGELDFGTGSFSVTGWAYLASSRFGERMINKGGFAFGDGWSLETESTLGDGLVFVLGSGGSEANSVGIQTASGTLNTSGWNFIAVVVDQSSDRVRLYINGQQIDVTKVGSTCGTETGLDLDISACGSLNASSSVNLNFGAHYNGIAAFNDFTGRVDEVKIYNYARTSSQIMYDYNRGGPVAWWKFDECTGNTTYDSSGNALNGTITVGGSGTQTAVGDCSTAGSARDNGEVGKMNYSLNFDGTDDYVQVADNDILDIGTSDFTLAAWINGNSMANGDVIFSKTNGDTCSSTYGFHFSVFDSIYPTLHFCTTTGDHAKIQGTQALSNSQWYHIAIVVDRDNSSNTKVYVNGKEVSTNVSNLSSHTGDITNALNLRIASESDGASYWDGKIDEPQLFKYTLSASQVRNLVNQNAGVRFGPTTGNP